MPNITEEGTHLLLNETACSCMKTKTSNHGFKNDYSISKDKHMETNTSRPTTQGKNMSKPTFKYPATPALTAAEQIKLRKEYLVEDKDSTLFDASIVNTGREWKMYYDPEYEFRFISSGIDAILKCGYGADVEDGEDGEDGEDYIAASMYRDMSNTAFSLSKKLLNIYEQYNDEEKLSHDKTYRLEIENESRKYLEVAMSEAKTSDDYSRCAYRAGFLYGEQEVTFKLYEKSIKDASKNNIEALEDRLNDSMEESNLTELQKVELRLNLQEKVKSLV